MKYAKLINGEVKAISSLQEEPDYIEVPDYVELGFRQPLSDEPWRKNNDMLLARLVERRWEEETNGCTITLANQVIFMDTSRENRANIMNHYIAAKDGLVSMTTYWKMLDGWVLLTETDIQEIISQTHSYVQSCFMREAELQVMLVNTSEDMTSVIEAFWPVE